MIECIVVSTKDISENDYDLFKPSPFLKKRYKQMLQEGFITEPLVARKIKTFGVEQKYKLLGPNYHLREAKKLGFKEIMILAHPIMSEDMASSFTLHIAEKQEIVKREKVHESMAEVRKNYSDEELQRRLGIEELIPLSEKFDIPTYELSDDDMEGMELNKKIEVDLIGLKCPNCGHIH